jgi:hypothetical protein
MSHLTADELVDAAEGTLESMRVAHASECAMCRGEIERLQMVLRAAMDADVPEPSPLFWAQLSSRVHQAIATEETTPRHWTPEWLRWPVLAPIAALAIIVMALATGVARDRAVVALPPTDRTAVDTAPDLDSLGEEEWAVVSELVGPVDFEQAREAGIVVRPGDVEEAALELTAAEQQVLLELMHVASGRPGL